MPYCVYTSMGNFFRVCSTNLTSEEEKNTSLSEMRKYIYPERNVRAINSEK